MKLLGRKQAPQGLPDRPFSTGAYGEVYSLESRQDFVEAYRDRVWVRRCIDLIAGSTNRVPVEVLVRGEWVREHRLIDFLDRPNPRDPSMTFFWWTTKWAQMVGEWYWELLPARDGGLAGAFPLRSHLVNIKQPEENTPANKPLGYLYRPEGSLQPKEFVGVDPTAPKAPTGTHAVLSGRIPSPLDDYYGMPPLRGAKDDVISEYYAIRYDHRFFRNSARPDVILDFEQLDDADREANKEAWREFQGVDNAHRAAVMSRLKGVHLLSQNQRDVEYLDGRKLAREGECGAFGVPPVLVGILDRATYSNYREAKLVFWAETMLDWLEFLSSWASWTLVPFYDDVDDLRFATQEVEALQEAKGWLSERIGQQIKDGIRTQEEGREELGLDWDPESGEDFPEEASRLHLPLSLVAQKPDADKQAPPPATGNGNGNGEVPTDPSALPEAVVGADGQTVEPKHRKDADLERWSGWLAARGKLLDAYSMRTLTVVSEHFAEVEKKIGGLVSSLDKATGFDLEQLLDQHDWTGDSAALADSVAGQQIGLVLTAIEMTAEALAYEVSDKEDLVLRTLKALQDRPDGIGSVTGRVKQDVLEQVRTGIAHGLTHRQIAKGGVFQSAAHHEEEVALKGIQGVFDEYKTWQADRIARTETAVAFNRGSSNLMREAGIHEVDIVDGEEDEACASANGEVWTLEQYESDPIEHPNCTRVGLPRVESAVAA